MRFAEGAKNHPDADHDEQRPADMLKRRRASSAADRPRNEEVGARATMTAEPTCVTASTEAIAVPFANCRPDDDAGQNRLAVARRERMQSSDKMPSGSTETNVPTLPDAANPPSSLVIAV